MTDEEQDILKEKRERLRKKDQEELLLQNAKNNKGKSAPAKADLKKGGKPDPKAKEVEAVHEEEKP